MKIEKDKSYYIEAKSKGIVFFPNGKYFLNGEEIKGKLEGSTLLMVENAIDIISIEEIKNNKELKVKAKQEVSEEVSQEPIVEPKDIEKDFEDMLKED